MEEHALSEPFLGNTSKTGAKFDLLAWDYSLLSSLQKVPLLFLINCFKSVRELTIGNFSIDQRANSLNKIYRVISWWNQLSNKKFYLTGVGPLSLGAAVYEVHFGEFTYWLLHWFGEKENL